MTDALPTPIDTCLDAWHQHLRGALGGGLDALLHDDVVFYSPIVFRPITDKATVKLYLSAAGNTFGGDPAPSAAGSSGGAPAEDGRFRYTRTLRDTHDACLEFETTMDGVQVNGVDLIKCDDAGRIIEFRVMVRPLRAVNTVHAQMGKMLELMAAAAPEPKVAPDATS